MPGLKQLEKFRDDIHGLGDEEQVRLKRGEKMSEVPLPEGISEDDDSDDFILGLPETADDDVDESASYEDEEAETAEPNVDLNIDSLGEDSVDMDSLAEFDSPETQNETDVEELPNDALGEIGEEEKIENNDADLNEAVLKESETVDFGEIGSSATPQTEFPEEDTTFNMDSLLADDPSLENSAPLDTSENATFEENESQTVGEEDGSSVMNDFLNDGEISNGEIPDGAESVPDDDNDDAGGEFDASQIDISEMDMEESHFDSPDEEFAETHVDGDADDFLLSEDYDIQGYTDTDSADLSKKVDTVDFKAAKAGAQQPKNSLTDEEYARFKKNLSEYPLNLKVIIEDTIAKDGEDAFNDETCFEIIEKVLKRTSAQKLAAYMEKLLDVQILIPRDFEHRSYEQYEAYKQSFEYQLKNRIIPAAIVGVILLLVGIGLFNAGKHFIYKPVMASSYYKQGYELLENNEYPESEVKFKKAVEYRPMKKWFFKYARGYRAHRQYERAAQMYLNMLGYDKIVDRNGVITSVHVPGYYENDKNAGLEYAEMELYDRANFAEAERIVRRYVLDRHVNDPTGELLLGDVFLEWAEEEPEKYEEARKVYSELEERFPKEKLYQSRMLRYYIRTDKLREVLVYKPKFFPDKKSLSGQDWTELSGYLLDKLYGELSRNDEYLRSSIEDVLKMLEYAVSSAPSSPVARYNLARYYLHNGYKERAQGEMRNALSLFDRMKLRSKKDIYKEINASRILGELYEDSREYDEAQKVFTHGINRFNEEKLRTGLEGDENTGKLFADMGDIDYFITGDIDNALANYEMALVTKNDTPTINYRVGVIRYGRKDYAHAFASFVKVYEEKSSDCNLLLALGNVLSLRGDNFASQSYFTDLLRRLDHDRVLLGDLKPQEDFDDAWLVDMYLKAHNNLGVTLFRLARQTGNSNYAASAMTHFSESMRAWDALTRDQETMIRMEGGNLAAQNAKFTMASASTFEPVIYTDIQRTLLDEKILR